MAGDALLLAIAIACAVVYAVTLFILIWNNAKSPAAWSIVAAAIILWPFLFFTGAAQLLLAIPVATVLAVDGTRLRPSISTKAAILAVATTGGYAAIMIAVCFAAAE